MSEREIMGAEALGRTLRRMAQDVVERTRGRPGELAVVGIRRGGVHLAERLRDEIGRLVGTRPLAGTLDIALYRDDLAERGSAPIVGPTDLPFPVKGKSIVLVDDVLYTGRTVRAALDEIVDFGRPRRVWLAVLVDRGGRELPVAPDFVGTSVTVEDAENVKVRLTEAGAPADSVVVTRRGA